MDLYKKALKYFYTSIKSKNITNEQREVYKIAVNVFEAQINAGDISTVKKKLQ